MLSDERWGAAALARFTLAGSYLKIVDAIQADDWEAEYAAIFSSSVSIERRLALVHPKFYKNLGANADRQIRGERPHIRGLLRTSDRCNSQLLWNYECDSLDLVSDHYFPFGRGGPSEPDNKLVLCREHNEMKASDIHVYSWEQEPAWCASALKRIALHRGSRYT